MKYKLLVLLLISILTNGFSQDKLEKPVQLSWEDMILDSNYSFYDIQKSFNERWKTNNYIKDDGYKLYKRWEYNMESIVDSLGYFDKKLVEREYIKFKEDKLNSRFKFTGGDWELLGPKGFISHYGIGRVNVVGYDPFDADELWVGAASGGLWKSENGGLSWVSKSDGFRMMGVSDIVTVENNPDIIYIVTGDRDANDVPNYGILKSLDNGETWEKTNFPLVSRITRLIINPIDGNTLIASTNSGIYKTKDGGDNWYQVLNNKYIRDLNYKPGDFNIVYATDYYGSGGDVKFFRSDNSGESFTAITVANLPDTVSRVSIGVSIDNRNVVYLSAGVNKKGWDKQDFEGLYKSTDSGLTFERVEIVTPPILGSQSWYDWTFAVSPTDANELYAGGVRFYKSTDGGINWELSHNNFNPNNNDHFHVDHHYVGFQPGTNNLFVGNDGGVYKSENKGQYWTALNENLSITQYYKMSSSHTQEDLVICGAQDNGSHLLDDGDWNRVMGGDGMDCQIDYTNEYNMYASYQQGYLRKSINKGNNFRTMLSPNITEESGAWVTPFCIDPIQPNILYAGFESVWRSEDKGENWTNISGRLNEDALIRGIEISQSNTDIIFINYSKKIYKTTDKGASWQLNSKPSGEFVRDIAISPINSDNVWVAVNNRIYKSENGGSTWNDISMNLPNVPVTSVVVQSNEIEGVYLGTYIGVFYTDNTLNEWIPFDEGMPPVRIGELDLNEKFGKIYAGTYGRGVWKSNLKDFNYNIPSCTSLAYPNAKQRIFDTSVRMNWTQSDKASGYLLYAGTESGNYDLIDSLDLGNELSYDWQDVGYEGEIFVKIIAYNDDGKAQNCSEISFFLGCYFEDKLALIELYNKTGGENWLNKWDTSSCDISKWYGVRTNEDGRIVLLDLDGELDFAASANPSGNNLLGSIDNLDKFEFLKEVYLGGNILSGNLPAGWKGNKIITNIDISDNGFTGNFPDVLTKIDNLQTLNVSNNLFDGEISSDFIKLKKLFTLKLNDNEFSGKIPKSLGSMVSCEKIDLSNNEFTGNIPLSFWFMKNLKVLDISNNKLSGKLSKRIGKAKKIDYLVLNNNAFYGNIPKEFGNNTFYLLDLSKNELEGCFDDNLKNLCGSDYKIRTHGNIGLPKNGDFKEFCKNDYGNCDKIPGCVNGFAMLLGGNDTLYYNSRIVWQASDRATGYKISVGTTSKGIDIANNVDVGSNNSYDAGALPINVRIYVNITSYNSFGESIGCEELSFVTTDVIGVIENENDMGEYLNIYPNPANDRVVFERIARGELNLSIFNIDGREVLNNISFDSEEKEVSISMKHLPRGLYFVKMTIENIDYYKKLILE